MKSVFESFLDFLENASSYLEKISRPMERRLAYFFCSLQILVCVIAGAIAFGYFVVEFSRHTAWDTRMVLIGFIVVILLMLSSWVHMIITRDLKHLRDTGSKKKDVAKERKIEF